MNAGHVTASQRAPRPTIFRDFRKPGPEPAVQLAAFNESCGCAVGAACSGTCCDPCNSKACRRVIDGIASGGCGPCGACGPHGICPNGQTYPEYPTFNQGPPVGQTAYPYYTTRGPRDFLRDNPPSIGPY
ncbi:MAG TPA: hypothetical protein VEQ85_10825 [Lacipirellulaceae bacterium]|nr:hypothetical protein [Lacipirellulaceae bacterium]